MRKSQKTLAYVLVFALAATLLSRFAAPEARAASTTTRYEAEDGDVTHANGVNSSVSNASGKKGVVCRPTQYISLSVSVEKEGEYTVPVRYATGNNIGWDVISVEFTVNGTAALSLDFKNTGTAETNDGWNTFDTQEVTLNLQAGANTVIMKNNSPGDANTTTQFITFDYIEITEDIVGQETDTAEEETTTEDASLYPAAVGRHEAEDAFDLQGNNTASGDYYADCSGQAIVGINWFWINNDKNHITWKVASNEEGRYDLTLTYCAPKVSEFLIQVNGGDWLPFDDENEQPGKTAPATGGWNVTGQITTVIDLNEGANTISVSGPAMDNSSGDGNYFTVYEKNTDNIGSANLDCIDIAKSAKPDPAPARPQEGEILKTAKELQEGNLISFRGRNMTVGDAVSFDYSGSGFEFYYEGGGNVRASLTTTAPEQFAVDVDGTLAYSALDSKTGMVTLADDLAPGSHTIRVYKVKEAMTGLAQLNYLIFDENAGLKPVDADYKFLILGASSTCGSQMDPDTGAQNGYLAFPSLISRAYNATWQQISCSGRGCVQGTLGESGWAFSQENQISDLYKYQSWFRDKDTAFDANSYIPDVIITNFNNDFSNDALTNGYNSQEVFERMMAFIGTLRESYPDAYIVMTYGNYPNFDADGKYTNYQILEQYKTAVADYKSSSSDEKIDFVTFPDLVNGQSNHPSEEEHKYLAELISAKVSQFLGVENPLPLSHFEIESGVLNNAADAGKATKVTDWASKFSDNGYVEGMNLDIKDAAVADDGSNVRYVSVPVVAQKAGFYLLRLVYATDGTPDVCVRANGGAWNTLNLESTGDWAKPGANTETEVQLNAGENTIDVTGAIHGSYVCLDRIDLIYEGEQMPELDAPVTLGFQMNTDTSTVAKAGPSFRIVSSVNGEFAKDAYSEYGTIMAKKSLSGTSALTLEYAGSNPDAARVFKATAEGTVTVPDADDTLLYYALTLTDNGVTASALTTDYEFRAYAKKGGKVSYGDAVTVNINQIAENLYKGQLASGSKAHEYLYDNVLNVVSIGNNIQRVFTVLKQTINDDAVFNSVGQEIFNRLKSYSDDYQGGARKAPDFTDLDGQVQGKLGTYGSINDFLKGNGLYYDAVEYTGVPAI